MTKIGKQEPVYYGGQAVMEGVMMRGKSMYAMAVRRPDHEIELVKKDLPPLSAKYPFLKLPVVRGVVSFVDSLVVGMKIITISAEIAGFEEEEGEPSKWEVFLQNKLGDKLNDVLIYFSVGLAIFLAVGLFVLLPTVIGSFLAEALKENLWALGIAEGFLRIGIFLLYIILISRLKEIRRVFEYHGAEHKTINCFESKEELTVENVRKHSRLHRRCGTSFLLIVMIVSMIVFLFVQTRTVWLRFLTRIVLVPVIAGLSYEVIKWAGRSEGMLVKVISYPGMCLQKLTTAEPDSDEIETAIAALKGVLESEANA